MPRQLSKALLLLGLLLAAPAHAGSRSSGDPGKAKLVEGMRLFNEKRYDEAMVALRQGYAMSNKPEFLYAMGQVERIRGNCKQALLLYRSFLDTNPPASQVESTQLQIERCEKVVKREAKAAEPKPAPAPAATESRPEPPKLDAPKAEAKPAEPPKPALTALPPAPQPAAALAQPSPADVPSLEHRAWYRDGVGDALLATGVVALGGGGTLFMLGRSSASAATQSLDDYKSARASTWQQPAGVGLMAGGGALIVGSVLRYSLAGRGGSTSIGAAPTAGGGAVVVGGTTP